MKCWLFFFGAIGLSICPASSGAEANISPTPILTPRAGPAPQINGARIYGCRPGNPFLYRVPCTGQRPIIFSADRLPATLSLDAATGIITGVAPARGRYKVALRAENSFGSTARAFQIVAGDTLALTPPMGWNSWYIHYNRVSENAMRRAADQMIATGMADFGYQYVNNDDCWNVMPQTKNPDVGGAPRDASGRMLPNKRYPDIKGMVDYIHAYGLKAGIYCSPGPLTCGGFEGSWQHESQDAATFADWGFDFLKYDWCSYDVIATGGDPSARNLPLWNKNVKDLAAARRPFQTMSVFLRRQHRDIVFNLCQYGLMDVWKWGGEVGQCWRTTDDLGLQRGDSLPGFYHIAFENALHWKYARPGAWNDPDYILIGWIGDARKMGEGRKTALTPQEQYSYMSLWSLMAAPLIFSGDMDKLDAFTLNVLCNAEVVEVDQDPLGRQAKPLRQTAEEYLLVKDLEGGSKAIGLFNLTSEARIVSVTWKELGLLGGQGVHDLWRQKDLGRKTFGFAEEIPPHGVALLRVQAQP